MDRTGSGLCPVVGFVISSIECMGSATTELIYIIKNARNNN
jgi:hypothetical protein